MSQVLSLVVLVYESQQFYRSGLILIFLKFLYSFNEVESQYVSIFAMATFTHLS